MTSIFMIQFIQRRKIATWLENKSLCRGTKFDFIILADFFHLARAGYWNCACTYIFMTGCTYIVRVIMPMYCVHWSLYWFFSYDTKLTHSEMPSYWFDSQLFLENKVFLREWSSTWNCHRKLLGRVLVAHILLWVKFNIQLFLFILVE